MLAKNETFLQIVVVSFIFKFVCFFFVQLKIKLNLFVYQLFSWFCCGKPLLWGYFSCEN
ncbi:hypothetical protein THF1C08_250065 [Vibrio jasicida]|uniref:Uncharacterized protein n=1 Tax=Vibrio jasicida TaxID=766224 RepID=A0AAU9QLL0_9VIBR|nr:hypothetical protein THF1C08_250065 [Vibrio jasicida]CAH1592478.1 hypothetical protein THF1A12_250067 [Vibrio jasicida]